MVEGASASSAPPRPPAAPLQSPRSGVALLLFAFIGAVFLASVLLLR